MAKGVKVVPTGTRPTGDELTEQQWAFVRSKVANPSSSANAARAAGYAESSIYVQASVLMKMPKIQKAILALRTEANKAAALTAADVTARYLAIADANPADVTQLQRHCCRFCYGVGHEYQWTEREFKKALALYPKKMTEWNAKKPDYRRNHATEEPEKPSDIGGMGFDPRMTPNDDCPACFGYGEAVPFVEDTRKLSDSGLALYEGIEVTQHGIKVKTNSRIEALNKIGESIGMFVKKVELSGKVVIADKLKEARERAGRR